MLWRYKRQTKNEKERKNLIILADDCSEAETEGKMHQNLRKKRNN